MSFLSVRCDVAITRHDNETLIEMSGMVDLFGYQPEIACFEVIHELKLIDEHVHCEMKRILKKVQTGEFAREWIVKNQSMMSWLKRK